jgi:hypothetical protein
VAVDVVDELEVVQVEQQQGSGRPKRVARSISLPTVIVK